MKKSQLAKAIAMVAAGSALTVGTISNASAHVMYNTYNNPFGTDGWTRTDGSGNSGTPVPWVGTENGVRPFDYVGKQAMNWAVAIHSDNESHEVSQAHALSTYGAVVDLDTADGAWGAWQTDPLNPGFTQGWAHHTDYGLLKSDVTAVITISPQSLGSIYNNAHETRIDNFGITVFKGMDDGTAGFSHHAAWNIGYISGAYEDPAKVNNPHGTNNVIYLTHSDSGDITFTALAGQIYSIYLGGNIVGGRNFGDVENYKLTITAAPVPIPAAAWLLGSSLIGLISFGCKRNRINPESSCQ